MGYLQRYKVGLTMNFFYKINKLFYIFVQLRHIARFSACAVNHKFFLVALLLSSLLLFSCLEQPFRVREGFALMESGNYDAALEQFQRAYMETPDNPILLGGLGMILSLKRATFVTATDMMERSLEKRKDDEKLRWELILLYLDAGMAEKALSLVGPDKISVERFFLSDYALIRTGIACIQNPGEKIEKQLLEFPDSFRKSYLLARCFVEGKWPKDRHADAVKLYLSMDDKKTACELAVLMKETPEVSLQSALTACRVEYPASLTLQRERPIVIGNTSLRKLFDDTLFTPGDPKIIPEIPDSPEVHKEEIQKNP